MILAFVLFFPVGIVLTACGGNSLAQKEITDLYIKKDGWSSTEQYVNLEYGDTIADITAGMSLVFRYSDGSEIEFNENNFSEEEFQRIRETYRENYYVANGWDEQTGERTYVAYTGSTYQNTILDVGDYKIEISLNQKTAIIKVCVEPAQLESKNVAVVILQNESNNYQSKINAAQQTYKYGMPVAAESYSDENYTSDYKLYVLDEDKNNQIISGTDVKEVKALPETYDGGTMCTAFPDIEVGTNMLEFYNAISEETEAETFEKKQTFLSAFGIAITTGYNYSDNTLIVKTESLKPGNYLLYVYYENKNYNDFYTEPTTELVVEKGVFNLKKAIRLDGQEWSEENAEEILSRVVVSVNYTFNAYNPLFNEGNVKALTAKYLNDNYFVDSNAQNSSASEVFGDVCFEVAGGGYTGIYGKFKLLEKNQFNQDIRFDSTDNGTTSAKVVFVFDSDWVYEYYEDDPTIYDVNDFDIQVNINKGQVYRPYCGTEDTLEREYTGEEISILGEYDGIILRDPNALAHSGPTSATAINTYEVTYSLIDAVNYEFIDDDYTENRYYGDNGTFTWKITKLDLDGQWGEDGFTTKTISYNETEQVNSYEITYVSGVRTITLALSGNSKYDLLLTKLPGRHIIWALDTEQTYQVVGAQISQEANSDVVTVSFTGLEDGKNYGYIYLTYSIAETAYSEAFSLENSLQIVINKANFTEEQEAEIMAAIGAEDVGNGEYSLDENHKIIISRVDMTLPNVVPDYSDANNLPATAVYGTWKIYYYENNEYVEKHNGEQLTDEDTIGWMFVFIPADDMYNGYEVYVNFIDDIAFVQEDMPAEVLAALKTEFQNKYGVSYNDEFVSTATITTVSANDGGYGTSPDTLPVHDNNAEGAFKGQWVICFDVQTENSCFDKELGDNDNRSYGTDEIINEDYIKSQDRNWRIKFKPNDGAYNPIEIQVNVVFE